MEEIRAKWDEILMAVRVEQGLSDISFKTWLQPLKPYDLQDGVVRILVPKEQMAVDYIKRKYYFPIKVAIAECTGTEYEIGFVSALEVEQEKPVYQAPAENSRLMTALEAAGVNPKYTFDTFVVGSNNSFAHAASLAVAESPGKMYNPLFLYGGAGLGKTHLMHSIAHFIIENDPSKKVLYVTSERFTIEVIAAIRNSNNTAMAAFREKYRSVDVLLVDDVQFIIGKESTQEEFFHTFNELHGNKKQIILSSDKPPKEIETLEDRLRTRFEWGLLADISSPDYETRMAILENKMEMNGYSIEDEQIKDAIKYIATNIKSSVRELEGALNKLFAFSKLEKRQINVELAEEALKDMISPNQARIVTPELIMETVAEHFHIEPADIISTKRNSSIVIPRQIFMYLCRELLEMPLKSIANYVHKKDHTTVMHGISRIEEEMKQSENMKNSVDIIRKKLS